jgi:hypothetical protein
MVFSSFREGETLDPGVISLPMVGDHQMWNIIDRLSLAQHKNAHH